MKAGLAGCAALVLLLFIVLRPSNEGLEAQNAPENNQVTAQTNAAGVTPDNKAPSNSDDAETDESADPSNENGAPDVASNNAETSPPPKNEQKPNTDVAQPNGEKPSENNDEEKQGDEKKDEGILLSFKQANIDMISQWLAETTGKSIVKHPQVNCKLTIISTLKMSKRSAIELVYQALALEGFNAIESTKSIFILPEGQQPKISPTLIDSDDDTTPESRQPVVRVFQLNNIKSSQLKEKVKNILSKTGTIETDDEANKVIATDFAENIQLLSELIQELDVISPSDSVIEIFELKYAEAEELSGLLGGILNGVSAPSSRSSSSSSYRRSPSPRSSGNNGSEDTRLWADTATNRLIVSCPKARMNEIKRLVLILDSEKPTDVAVRVIPLIHVDSQELMREIAPLYEKLSGTSLKETIEVTANSRSNSLIVLSSESNFQAMQELIRHLDNEDAQETVIKAFPLSNADATDVSEQLRELYQGGTSSSSRYTYVYNYGYGRGGSSDKKPSFVADIRRNTVIVQAPPASLEGIEEMIQSLDEPITDDSLVPRIFQLKYVSAVDIEEVLNELFI